MQELLDSTVRTAFMGFITRSRNKPNKLEAAKELKALVYFSNMVVTPLLEDINVSPPPPPSPPPFSPQPRLLTPVLSKLGLEAGAAPLGHIIPALAHLCVGEGLEANLLSVCQTGLVSAHRALRQSCSSGNHAATSDHPSPHPPPLPGLTNVQHAINL